MAGRRNRGSKHKKSEQKQKDTGIDTDILTCTKCTSVFVDPEDKLLECERCKTWFCIDCAAVEPSVYSVMVSNTNLHWFCQECEKPALTAVKSDKEIEEKCAAYMNTLTERMDKFDEKLESKSDKTVVESLIKRVELLEKKGTGEPTTTASELGPDTVCETISEQKEREFRARNLVIKNLPESEKSDTDEKIADDIKAVGDLLSVLNIEEDNMIEQCARLGKKEAGKNRFTRITVNSEQTRREILKGAKGLKDDETYKDIYIGPDLTKLQREEQYKLRKELRDRKDNGEKGIFIRGRRIIQRKEKALQFKGGAAAAVTESD